MAEPLLRVVNLSKRYGAKEAIIDVDLWVGTGQTFVVIGPSGAGKTTLARTILCLTRPDAGQVHFAGAELTGLRGRALRERRLGLQMMFQDSQAALNPRSSVHRLLRDPLRHLNRRARAARIDEAMGLVDLDPALLPRRPHTLSGGQRQRVALARALLADAKLIVLDEPMASQDPLRRLHLARLLQRLQHERQLSYLVITHDLETAGILAHRIGIMVKGRLVETGPAKEMLSRPASDAGREILAARLPLPSFSRLPAGGPSRPE